MNKTTHRSYIRAILPMAIAVVVLAGLAPTPVTRTDNFNNNALAPFWEAESFGNATVTEVNSRLEFRNTGPTGALSSAGVLFKPYGINWKKNFHIEWVGRLNLNTVNFPARCFMGTVLVVEGEFPATMTGLAAGFYRDGNGLTFGVLRFVNGAITNINGSVVVSGLGGLVEIDWDKSMDRLTAELTPGPTGFDTGFYADFGATLGNQPMAIIQGVLMLDGNVSVPGSRCRIDNWEATFTKRAFSN